MCQTFGMNILLVILWSLLSSASAETDLGRHQNKNLGTVTATEFRATIQRFKRVFAPYAQREGRELEIFSDWREDWAQAFARRWETDQLIVYGGIARVAGSTVDSFALILCHELGHLYGGEPLNDVHNRIAVEGQADWWATRECWDQILPELPVRAGTPQERGFVAALIVANFFAANRSLPAPSLETPDPTVVPATLRTHPEPQCRLDTFRAGLEGLERPLCWFRP